MRRVMCDTIGGAWLMACKTIMEMGKPMKDEEEELRELMQLSLKIRKPGLDDTIIETYGNKEMLRWMFSNFLEKKLVPELKNSDSYGTRLFDYNGKDQIEWVINKLKKKPETKAATITMLMPNSDSGYIPCVSMLDFKIRDGGLVLTTMCRSIDFGNKFYANMLALHKIQRMVAEKLDVPVGEMVFHIVSAHIYEKSFGNVKEVLEKEGLNGNA